MGTMETKRWRIEIQEGRPHGKSGPDGHGGKWEKWAGCDQSDEKTASSALPPHVGTRFYAFLSRLNQLTAAVSDWAAPRGLRVPDQRPFFAFHSARELAGDVHLPWFSTSTPLDPNSWPGRWLVGCIVHSFVRPSLVCCCRPCRAACKRQTPSAGPGPGSRPDPPPTASFSVSHCSVAKRASARVTLGPLGINPAPFCQPPLLLLLPAPARALSSQLPACEGPTSCRPKQTIASARPQPPPAHRTRHSDL